MRQVSIELPVPDGCSGRTQCGSVAFASVASRKPNPRMAAVIARIVKSATSSPLHQNFRCVGRGSSPAKPGLQRGTPLETGQSFGDRREACLHRVDRRLQHDRDPGKREYFVKQLVQCRH